MGRFHYLKVGLGMVLVFVGAKMVASDIYRVPIGVSLAVVAALIGGSVVVSLLTPPGAAPVPVHERGGRPVATPLPEDGPH